MKNTIYFTSIILGILTSTLSFGQQRPDSLKPVQQKQLSPEQAQKRQLTYYKSILKADSAKAGKVSKIMADYKAAMSAVSGEMNQNQDEKRAKIKALIEGKNKKLKALLTPAQQARLIPLSEREPQRGAKPDSTHRPLNR